MLFISPRRAENMELEQLRKIIDRNDRLTLRNLPMPKRTLARFLVFYGILRASSAITEQTNNVSYILGGALVCAGLLGMHAALNTQSRVCQKQIKSHFNY